MEVTMKDVLEVISADKCAPGTIFKEGSCFSLEQLHDMVDIYNCFINMNMIEGAEIINKSDNKLDMLKTLVSALINACSDDICLIKESYIYKYVNNSNTVRPFGPSGQFTWLSNFNIQDVIRQYEKISTDFKFLGVVPMDFNKFNNINIQSFNIEKLYNKGIYKIGIIVNTDNHNQSGSHWVSVFCNLQKLQLYYYDSVANPPSKQIRELIKYVAELCYYKKHGYNTKLTGKVMSDNSQRSNYEMMPDFDIKYNTVKHQYENSECGLYCINFIIRMLNNVSFTDHINTPITDMEINKCRNIYFNNSNIVNDIQFDRCE